MIEGDMGVSSGLHGEGGDACVTLDRASMQAGEEEMALLLLGQLELWFPVCTALTLSQIKTRG